MLHKVGERRLARARAPDNAYLFAGTDLEIDIFQDQRQIDAITERDVGETDCAVDARRTACSEFLRKRLRAGVENVAYTLERHARHDHTRPHR